MFEKSFNKINVNNELNEAVIAGDCERIKKLFEAEDKPYVDHEINGVAVILYAAQHKNWDIVEELYNQEANLDVKVPYLNWFLIHECIKNAPERVTKAVIEYCDINAKTKDGKTPLMVAIKEDKIEMANYLTDLGTSDLSLVDKEGENAGHYAVKTKNYDLFFKLIEKNIPLTQKNKEGLTSVDLISDVSLKENLPKIIGQFKKIKDKEITQETTTELVEKVDEVVDVEEKPKLKGLSSIKRK